MKSGEIDTDFIEEFIKIVSKEKGKKKKKEKERKRKKKERWLIFWDNLPQ